MKMKLIQSIVGATLCIAAFSSHAAITKAEHTVAINDTETVFKRAKSACASLAGNAKDVCVAQAKAEKVYAVAKIHNDYKNTEKSVFDGRKNIAEAEFDLAKTKCAAKAGNDKDVCIKEAKALEVRALEDAKAGEKVSEARADAYEAKNNANYKVAIEKCDAFSGDTKESCVKVAKANFSK